MYSLLLFPHALSGKAWVFRYITQSIFPKLFGDVTVQRNRLGLTDEDPLEYRTFEANTKSDKNYQQSKVMLCTFHTIWKPFKETIRPRLPKKSGGVLLSTIGKSYGAFMMSNCITQLLLSKYFDTLLTSGSTIMLWIMCICTEHETKHEHDRPHLLLKEFLRTKKVKRHLSADCISAILKYGEALICKQITISCKLLTAWILLQLCR